MKIDRYSILGKPNCDDTVYNSVIMKDMKTKLLRYSRYYSVGQYNNQKTHSKY